jgi:hypothetical protein
MQEGPPLAEILRSMDLNSPLRGQGDDLEIEECELETEEFALKRPYEIDSGNDGVDGPPVRLRGYASVTSPRSISVSSSRPGSSSLLASPVSSYMSDVDYNNFHPDVTANSEESLQSNDGEGSEYDADKSSECGMSPSGE